MSSNLGNRIMKLLDFLGYSWDTPFELYFLRDGREKMIMSYDSKSDSLICNCWDEYYHNGSAYNEVTLNYAIADVGDKVHKALLNLALNRIEKEFKEKEEQERRKKKIEYLNEKIYGKSISFIMED